MSPQPFESTTDGEAALAANLRSLEQGDLISVGAVAIVGTTTSEVTGAEAPVGLGVASITVETPSGWYAVLTQDCDIVRTADLEPCIAIAPVLYVPPDEWDSIQKGLGSYRRYALDPDDVEPLDEAHAAAVGDDHRPVVDIRYISSLDKTALAEPFDVSYPLRGLHKIRFQDWVGSRFSRESFANELEADVLPVVRAKLKALQSARRKKQNDASPLMRLASTCSQWYIRATDRYVEILGRLDPTLSKENGFLKIDQGQFLWNTRDLDQAARTMSRDLNKRIAGSGYAVTLFTQDFEDLSVVQFETYALWLADDADQLDGPPPGRG